jgi:hypothetical protein
MCLFLYLQIKIHSLACINSLIYIVVRHRFSSVMASRAKAKPPKKRQQRATSNIFAMFDQSQIQEYKEAFNIIDHDRVKYTLTCSIIDIHLFV